MSIKPRVFLYSFSGPTVPYSYTYDDLARKTSETLLDGTETDYGYDAAGRLTSEVRWNSPGSASNYSLAYTCDYAANRTSKTLNGTSTESYTYDSSNKLLIRLLR